MVAGARTFTLEDTFLAPQILHPPPTRHALLAFLLTLAAVLHIATAGWGDLYDGVEGQFAGGAREMLESRQWLVPTNNAVPLPQTPPLAYWLVALSFKVFGVTATAARLPIALAMIGSVAFTFLIGERLAGYWRGFAAGLIHLCSAGGFLLGRMVTADSIFALTVSAAVYCAVCGYQYRKFRRWWFAGFWFCAALACLAKGPAAILYPAVICGPLALLFREARMRFARLLHWSNLLLFFLLVAPWFVWAQNHFPGFWPRSLSHVSIDLPRWRFLVFHLANWFPAILLVLPGLIFGARKIFRPNEFTFADALPLCWLAAGFLPLLPLGERQVCSSLVAAPGFALFAAWAWERTSRPFHIAGVALALLAGSALAATIWFRPASLGAITGRALPDAAWLSLRPMTQIAIVSLFIFSLPAFFFARKQRAEIALFLVLGAMLPIGFCLAESRSRLAPFFSLADAAQYLNPRLRGNGQVLFEGPLRTGNSLCFYLEKKFFLVNQAPDPFEQDDSARNKYLDEPFVVEAWNRASPIYLIIEEDRVLYWRKLITDRVHIYHQVTSCGSRVVLSNQL